MMTWVMTWVLLLLALFSGSAQAQNFTGYPPPNTVQIGNDTLSPPVWRPFSIIPQGRLTLQSHTPVMTTTQAAKSSIFYDCYNGSVVPVFNGTVDVPMVVASCEISDALPNSGTGVVNANGVFDEFAINVGGALTLCHVTNGSGGGWLSDTGGNNQTRGTGYSALDNFTRPYVTNAGALNNCYNGATNYGPVAANNATHLGTFATDSGAAGSVTWHYGLSGAPPTAAIFSLWNRFNRVNNANTLIADTAASWPYATATIREAHGDTTFFVNWTVGERQDSITARYGSVALSSVSTTVCNLGVGFDATNLLTGIAAQTNTTTQTTLAGGFTSVVGPGNHTVYATEFASTATCTFSGGGLGGLTFNGPPM